MVQFSKGRALAKAIAIVPTIQNLNVLSGFQMVFHKIMDFKWFGIQISDSIWNPYNLQTNLFLTIQNPDKFVFQIPNIETGLNQYFTNSLVVQFISKVVITSFFVLFSSCPKFYHLSKVQRLGQQIQITSFLCHHSMYSVFIHYYSDIQHYKGIAVMPYTICKKVQVGIFIDGSRAVPMSTIVYLSQINRQE